MSRRLGVLAVVIFLLLAAVVVQAFNIQYLRAPALDASPLNPRNSSVGTNLARGSIYAADGSVLAESVPAGSNVYRRVYPFGSLTAGVVGFSSPTYGTYWLEAQYNSYLTPHAQPPQSFEQLLAPTSAADSVTTTLEPALERVAARALAGQDGAAVVLNPTNGDVLAMYSNPTYNPAPLTSSDYAVASAAWKKDITNNAHGFPPLGSVATQQTFPPGSTFKIVTTSAVVTQRPDLFTKVYPVKTTISLPNSNKTLSNFGFGSCGGDIPQMLPPSCDTGYALLGLDLGANALAATANSFGINQTPPLDFPGVVPSFFPAASDLANNLPFVAYSAIGQGNVRLTALQNALVAATIANHGVMMAPHFLSEVTAPDGTVVKRYKPQVWQTPLTPAQASEIVPLMQNVVKYGTAAGIFPAADNVAAKTGTAQVGNAAKNTDDWMIAFAPANAPTIAVAVVLPFQSISQEGATAAGPVIKCLVEGALALQAGLPASGTSTTCPS
ncbi:MAG: penicillin-binding protein 2 [Acidobacteriota bacterium]|nr:penicillin-binding protein 2 [Acidobacteriota bacterium]MDE3043607.1 penicillin-binding protein 2 [Acidobacteriota bacterium]MDE3106963.1 penicillin-binding protein 2 [Acidobacteriota bacterium]